MPFPPFPVSRAPALLTAMLLCPWALGAEVPAPDEPQALEARTPKWEAGLLMGGGRVSDYPGADQAHARGLVAPVLIYRGSVVRVDRDGIRSRLAQTSDWEFDLSASAAFNARNNEARRGMPGLDYLFGLGPQLIYKGLRERAGEATLHLNLRAVMSTDFRRVGYRGAVIEPELRWQFGDSAKLPGQVSFGVQPAWATRALQGYFYDVDPSEALPQRPVYRAQGGYLGTEFKLTLSRRYSEHLSGFLGLRALSLHGAANTGSTLLRDKLNLNVGAGVLWTPWRSAARAKE